MLARTKKYCSVFHEKIRVSLSFFFFKISLAVFLRRDCTRPTTYGVFYYTNFIRTGRWRSYILLLQLLQCQSGQLLTTCVLPTRLQDWFQKVINLFLCQMSHSLLGSLFTRTLILQRKLYAFNQLSLFWKNCFRNKAESFVVFQSALKDGTLVSSR